MKLPRWGSRVRIPSSAPQRGSLTCDYVEVPGTGASFLDGYSHESPTKSCRGGVGVHPGLAKKASKGEWTGGTPPFGYLYSQNVWVPRVRIEVLDPFGPERHSRTARSCSADAGTARSLGRQTGCRSSIAARRAAGLAHFRLHDLRHFMATEMLAAGVPSPRCPSASATPGRRPPSVSTRIHCRGVTARRPRPSQRSSRPVCRRQTRRIGERRTGPTAGFVVGTF